MFHRPADRTVARQLRTASALRRAVRSTSANPPARGRHRATTPVPVVAVVAVSLVVAALGAWIGATR